MEKKDKFEIENNIDHKILIVKNVLDNVYKIFTLFKPLIARMMEMEEAQDFIRNGTFEKASFLFGKVSEQCKELSDGPFSDDFLKNLKN